MTHTTTPSMVGSWLTQLVFASLSILLGMLFVAANTDFSVSERLYRIVVVLYIMLTSFDIFLSYVYNVSKNKLNYNRKYKRRSF